MKEAIAAQGEHHVALGMAFAKGLQRGFGFCDAGQRRGFHLVHDQQVNIRQVISRFAAVHRRHIERHPGGGCRSAGENAFQVVDFVLQQQPILGPQTGVGGVEIRLGEAAVGTTGDGDGVRALRIDLNHRVARCAGHFPDARHIDLRSRQRFLQPTPVGADASEVGHGGTGPRRRQGLVEPLAAGMHRMAQAGDGLAGRGDVGNGVNVVHAEGTEVYQTTAGHSLSRPRCAA